MADIPAPRSTDPAAPSEPPLRSVHTVSFAEILERNRISVLVTTYQAGKLIVLRSESNVVNTHFRTFPKPMGLVADGARLAIGTAYQVWELENMPEACARLDPPEKHDACYIPRRSHVTGYVDIHEMARPGGELWFVNTRFSCLCSLDERHNFVPRWTPRFISQLAAEDRCHLNGLGIRDERPRYVTALGTTDAPQGWRENKATGGCLIDLESGEFILRDLSMPHSPRWQDGKLWVLESGAGKLCVVDELAGKTETVAQLPGFTRGFDFYGGLAFIGLSQVRESAVFSGIPIAQPGVERHSGVWVVHLATGRTVAFLRFEAAVQEIFAVQVLPGIRFPEVINDDEKLIANSFILPVHNEAALRPAA